MASAQKKKKQHKHSLKKRILIWVAWAIGILIALAIAVYVAFQVSPWPSSLLVRFAFNQDAQQRLDALQKHAPANVSSILDRSYRKHDKDALLDVYFPSPIEGSDTRLPTIFWVHGGGWISGDKKYAAPYFQILANKGYTVVSINYSLAPGKTYPTPVEQTSEALEYVQKHAGEFHIDTNQFIFAGDSAGSQIIAQVATLATNADYAKTVEINPNIKTEQIRGMVLNCGAYDLSIVNTNGNDEGAQLLRTFLWAYSGQKNFSHDSHIAPASVAEYVTKDFPPAFITAGNNDPLLPQSQLMVEKLKSLGVSVDALFFPSDYQPALPHEYQFNLDNTAGQQALDQISTFIDQHTEHQ